MDKSELAQRLQAWRAGREISQSEAARIIGVPLGTYRDWEQGAHCPVGLGLAALVERIGGGESDLRSESGKPQ